MAGHSHWAGIKHKKGKADKARSNLFSKLSREITVAAKLGDKDPDMNARLRSAIQTARSANMPKENRLLRPENLIQPSPGKGFEIFKSKNDFKIGVLNLMGNIFMKKCDDVFEASNEFIKKNNLKEDYDFLVVDFHGEITSEKMAMGHFFDGKATLVVGTHTHVPTNDARILENGTAYLTDAGMCGDYNSVIGMDKNNSLNKFLNKESRKHFPAEGIATLSGVIIDANAENGLAKNIENFIYGGDLKNSH